jgi:hypothetical protein
LHRQDTWSDLQLFAVVNLGVIFLFSWFKTRFVDTADMISPEELEKKPFWLSIYEVTLPPAYACIWGAHPFRSLAYQLLQVCRLLQLAQKRSGTFNLHSHLQSTTIHGLTCKGPRSLG